MESQMLHGTLEMCILYQFLSGDYYGYDIMSKMKVYFPNVKDSTFYVILRRLNAGGYIEIYEGRESNGPKRKYYTITDAGREYLQKCIDSWKQIQGIVKEVGIV